MWWWMSTAQVNTRIGTNPTASSGVGFQMGHGNDGLEGTDYSEPGDHPSRVDENEFIS